MHLILITDHKCYVCKTQKGVLRLTNRKDRPKFHVCKGMSKSSLKLSNNTQQFGVYARFANSLALFVRQQIEHRHQIGVMLLLFFLQKRVFQHDETEPLRRRRNYL